MDQTDAIYGSWSSPIKSLMLTEGARKFDELRLDPTEKGKGVGNFYMKGTKILRHIITILYNIGVVYWAEGRPSEDGRSVICSSSLGQTIVDWTPPGFSVQSKVHEYGGGAFFLHNGVVYFVNADDQRFYKQESPDKSPVGITDADVPYRYADGTFFHVI